MSVDDCCLSSPRIVKLDTAAATGPVSAALLGPGHRILPAIRGGSELVWRHRCGCRADNDFVWEPRF